MKYCLFHRLVSKLMGIYLFLLYTNTVYMHKFIIKFIKILEIFKKFAENCINKRRN